MEECKHHMQGENHPVSGKPLTTTPSSVRRTIVPFFADNHVPLPSASKLFWTEVEGIIWTHCFAVGTSLSNKEPGEGTMRTGLYSAANVMWQYTQQIPMGPPLIRDLCWRGCKLDLKLLSPVLPHLLLSHCLRRRCRIQNHLLLQGFPKYLSHLNTMKLYLPKLKEGMGNFRIIRCHMVVVQLLQTYQTGPLMIFFGLKYFTQNYYCMDIEPSKSEPTVSIQFQDFLVGMRNRTLEEESSVSSLAYWERIIIVIFSRRLSETEIGKLKTCRHHCCRPRNELIPM
ncbi:hypothetical protein K1719_037391 [Acacia pycnantha]|nr:hypothetical protein K1719_037391 [Acacia pycnantha]